MEDLDLARFPDTYHLLKFMDRSFYPEEFFRAMSHGLKTPLTSLKLEAQILARRLGKNPHCRPEDKQLAQALELQINRINDLADAMLDVAMIRTGHFKQEKSILNFYQLLQESIGKKGIKLWGNKAILFWGDERRIKQLLLLMMKKLEVFSSPSDIQCYLRQNQNLITLSFHLTQTDYRPDFRYDIFEHFPLGASLEGLPPEEISFYFIHEILHAHGGRIKICKTPQGKVKILFRIISKR
jgi:K+-sensing histidine kinase KdpD